MVEDTAVSARHARAAHVPVFTITALIVIGFVSVAASSITAMALAPLAGAFAVPMNAVVWVTTVYLLTAGLALPVTGWAVDRFGGRSVLLVGTTVFALGSLASGLTTSFDQLLIARAVQGIGGGSLEPACLALVAQITDRRRVGAVMGLMAAAINVAPVVGPLFGAALLGWGWRGIFLFAVPPMILAAVLLGTSLGTPQRGSHGAGLPTGAGRPMDVTGLALLGLGFASVLLAPTLLADGMVPGAVVTGLLGGTMMMAYARYARRTEHPIVDLGVFGDRRFSGAVAVMGIGGVVTFGMLTLLPLMADRSWGLGGLARAIPLGAFSVGMLVSMSVSGALSDRLGSRRIVAVGAGGTAVLMAGVAAGVALHVPAALCIALFALAGTSFGAVSAPTFASIYRVLPQEMAGRGTTAALIAVQLGAAAGVTGIGALVEARGEAAFTLVLKILSGLMVAAAAIARFAVARDAVTAPGPKVRVVTSSPEGEGEGDRS